MGRTYMISYRTSEDGWLASIYTVPGCHAEAETKDEARRRIVANLAAFYDDVPTEALVEDPVSR